MHTVVMCVCVFYQTPRLSNPEHLGIYICLNVLNSLHANTRRTFSASNMVCMSVKMSAFLKFAKAIGQHTQTHITQYISARRQSHTRTYTE